MKWDIIELKRIKRKYINLLSNNASAKEQKNIYDKVETINRMINIYNHKENDDLEFDMQEARNNIIYIAKEANKYVRENQIYLYLLQELVKLRFKYNGTLQKIEISDKELLEFVEMYYAKKNQTQLFESSTKVYDDIYYRRNDYEADGNLFVIDNKSFICLNRNNNLYDYVIITHEIQHLLDINKYKNKLNESVFEINSCLSNFYSIDLLKEKDLNYDIKEIEKYNINYNMKNALKVKKLISILLKYDLSKSSDNEIKSVVAECSVETRRTNLTTCLNLKLIKEILGHYSGFIIANLIYENNSLATCDKEAEKYISSDKLFTKETIDDSISILKKTYIKNTK